MDPKSEVQEPPKESFGRALACRLLGVVSVLSLWHIPDLWAVAIYAVGLIVFYYPHRAMENTLPLPWLRVVWFAVVGAVAAAFFLVDTPPPTGSVISPAAKYGLLALLAVQVLFDFVRRGQTLRKAEEGTAESRDGV